MVQPVIKKQEISFRSVDWYNAQLPFLTGRQFARTASVPLEDLLDNGLSNVLIVAAHQDDEIIGMGGTMKVLSRGLELRTSWMDDIDGLKEEFTSSGMAVIIDDPKGMAVYSAEEIKKIQARLSKGNLSVYVPSKPANVWVAYVTNGSKDVDTVMGDLRSSYPRWADKEILSHASKLVSDQEKTINELTDSLNKARYIETISALDQVYGNGAVFLEHPSSEIKSGNSTAVDELSQLIEFLQPERVYTMSPFEIKHDTHIFTGTITLDALRQAMPALRHPPTLRGYAVWNPFIASEPAIPLEIVDTSATYTAKLDALHMHSKLGSQGTYGFMRQYEDILDVDGVNGIILQHVVFGMLRGFNAQFKRPRLPSDVFNAEVFIPLDKLVQNPNMTYRGFVAEYFNNFLKVYPIK